MPHHGCFFSVIIPTYRRPDALRTCLAALARQDFPRDQYEVIVVDDGSDTSLEPLVQSFQGLMTVRLLRQRNAGPAAARNKGSQYANGRFLAFTDDDCQVAGDWLSRFAERFERNPNQLLGGQTINALTKNPCSSASQLILDAVYDHYNADPDRARFFASQNMAMPLDRYRQLGGFDTRFQTSEDRDLCDRWAASGLPLTYVHSAVMFHSHAMTLPRFFRQHFHYGRGAYRFHRARAKRGAGDFEVDSGFYAECFIRPFTTAKGLWALQLFSLLIVWQFANTLGFFHRAVQRQFEILDRSQFVSMMTTPRKWSHFLRRKSDRPQMTV